jgi:hypothetical protein
LGADLNSESVLLIKADTFSTVTLPAALSSMCSEAPGHGSVHGDFAKTCFCRELWLLRRNQKEVRGAEKLLRRTGVRLSSSAGRKIKA